MKSEIDIQIPATVTAPVASPARTDRQRAKAARRLHRLNRSALQAYAAPVAFPRDDSARHAIATNPNRAKRSAANLDRDSATAKRDGVATKGARLARKAPLGNRGQRFGNERTPSLPLTSRRAEVAS